MSLSSEDNNMPTTLSITMLLSATMGMSTGPSPPLFCGVEDQAKWAKCESVEMANTSHSVSRNSCARSLNA